MFCGTNPNLFLAPCTAHIYCRNIRVKIRGALLTYSEFPTSFSPFFIEYLLGVYVYYGLYQTLKDDVSQSQWVRSERGYIAIQIYFKTLCKYTRSFTHRGRLLRFFSYSLWSHQYVPVEALLRSKKNKMGRQVLLRIRPLLCVSSGSIPSAKYAYIVRDQPRFLCWSYWTRCLSIHFQQRLFYFFVPLCLPMFNLVFYMA